MVEIQNPTIKQLVAVYQPITLLNEQEDLLAWDSIVNAPEKGIARRAKQSAFVAEQQVNHFQSSEFRIALERASDQSGNLSPLESAILTNITQTSRYYLRVPPGVIIAASATTTEAMRIWETARENNSFKDFEPYLVRVIDLFRQIADYYGYSENPYDALLDRYNPGLTSSECHRIFSQLQPGLTLLKNQVLSRPDYQGNTPLTDGTNTYPDIYQEQIVRFILNRMGFDFTAGRIDRSTHPITFPLGTGDTRLTIFYNQNDFTESFTSTTHEGGHGLYYQRLNPDYAGISLDKPPSQTFDEGLARFWENMIGRHPAFLRFMTPTLQAFFPNQLSGTNEEDLRKLFNRVSPSPIRMTADEVTYGLHIIQRYELEHDLINGNLQVQDLPEAWRSKVKEYLGVEPQTDREGVLQDIHWSLGYLGYFPNYGLGDVYGAQILHTMQEQLNINALLQSGNLEPITSWLTDNIYKYGRLYSSQELLQRVTQEEANPQYLINYLRGKYLG